MPALALAVEVGLPENWLWAVVAYASLNGFGALPFTPLFPNVLAGLGGSCPDCEPTGELDESEAGGVSGAYNWNCDCDCSCWVAASSGLRSCVWMLARTGGGERELLRRRGLRGGRTGGFVCWAWIC